MLRTDNTYLVSPPYIAKRIEDERLQDGIVSKWQFRPKAPHLHNNLATQSLRFDTEKNAFILCEPFSSFRKPYVSAARVIASSLALYRLLCLFKKPPVVPQNAYKSLWEYPLQHRESKTFLTLLDYKAGFTINSLFSEPEDLPESFAFDLLELLNFLVSDQIAHPYDGTLAGTVA